MGVKDKLIKFWDGHPLLKIQIFYFFHCGATKTLSRYLGLYYKHTLLLSPHQVAVLLSARSFALLFGSPVLGTIADKTNRFRNILVLCLFSYIVTYFIVPFVEPVDGFNCREHFNSSQKLVERLSNNSLVTSINGKYKVKIHKYESEIKTDPLGQHYHGNLMYDLFYTWPLETWEYLATDDITKKVFSTLLAVTLIGEFFASPSETIADLYTLKALGGDQKQFGLIIIPGLFGWVIITLIFAIISNSNMDLQDDFCHIGHVVNYSPYLFIFYGMILACICIAFLLRFSPYLNSTEEKVRYDKVLCKCKFWDALVVFAKSPSYLAFTVVVIFFGFGMGIKQLYIYHYITDLGGSVILLPIVVAVHFLSDLVALVISPHLISKFGNIKVMYFGLLVYAVTFVVYSIIEEPWLVFLVEPFNGITEQLCWVAIITYVGAPPNIGAALQGSVHGLYRGFGISLGYLAVSVLILKYGYFTLFLSLGLIFLFVLFLYAGIVHFYPREETIAEAYSQYRLLFPDNNNDNESLHDDEEIYVRTSPNRAIKYDDAVLDSSFLEKVE